MKAEDIGRDARALALLEGLDDWQHVDEGPFGNTYWTVPSTSNPSRRYRVTSTSCTCLDFAYRSSSTEACKHMRALKTILRALRYAQETEVKEDPPGGNR